MIEPPADVRTVEELMGWLAKHGESYAHAFETPRVIRAAIDHSHRSHGMQYSRCPGNHPDDHSFQAETAEDRAGAFFEAPEIRDRCGCLSRNHAR